MSDKQTPPDWVLIEAAKRGNIQAHGKGEWAFPTYRAVYRSNATFRALCDMIEQHEAFRQEVSDAVVEYFDPEPWNCERAKRTFSRFIIAKPDPLVEVLDTLGWSFDDTGPDRADDLRAALAARGLEVREKQA